MRTLRRALAAASYATARASTLLWTAVAYTRLRTHGAVIGPGLRVRGPIRLHCHRTGVVRIGRECRIQSGFAGNAVGGNGRMNLWIGPGAELIVGDRVGLSNSTIVCLQAVTIGDHSLIGGDTRIYDTDFHSLDPEMRARPGNPGARTAPVTIAARSFIGGHSTLLKGSTIGESAVVGAGSVVRGDVPAGQVWSGNPASFVRDLRAVAGRAGRTDKEIAG